MNVYIFQAALLCEDCGLMVRAEHMATPGPTICQHATHRTLCEDSDCHPQGPYPHGGGEADHPQHCDHCGVFLENPLTSDGYEYVRRHVDIARTANPDLCSSAFLKIWAPFYGITLS